MTHALATLGLPHRTSSGVSVRQCDDVWQIDVRGQRAFLTDTEFRELVQHGIATFCPTPDHEALPMKAERHDLPTRPCTGRDCNAQIVDLVLRTVDGKRVRHVFDPEPVEGGKYRIDHTLLDGLEASHDPALTVGYVSHFATCPNSPQFRGRKTTTPLGQARPTENEVNGR